MLEVVAVTKRYGSLTALDSVTATFHPGEIHAVLGENGAGKSTLVGVMAGFVRPDAGEVQLDGTPLPLGRAFECKRRGVEMIHQHFTLVPAFTVEENLALARLDRLAVPARVADRAAPALAAARRLGWTLDPRARTDGLSVGEQQRLEILKALGGDARTLIFDEPTAVLAPDEVGNLFGVLRALRDEGRTIVIIAHKLSEPLAIADRVSVLRAGRVVATALRADVDEALLAEWMVGEMPGARTRTATQTREGLVVRGMTVLGDRKEAAVREVSFEVRRGEIFGVGGVDGNGQHELAEAIAGIRPFTGEKQFGSEEHDARVGYVPQDRQGDGLAMGMSVGENLLLAGYRRAEFSRGPFLRLEAIAAWIRRLIGAFEIKVASPRQAVASLSGGNQQKVVVSRTFDTHPELLVVVSPTRGLDLRATHYVRSGIRAARAAGAAVLLVTTDLDELVELSDRTAFMSRGELRIGSDARLVVGGSA